MRHAHLNLFYFLSQELLGPHTLLSYTHCFLRVPKLLGFCGQLGLPLLNTAKKLQSIFSLKLSSLVRIVQWESCDGVNRWFNICDVEMPLTCHHPFKFHNRDSLSLLWINPSPLLLMDEFKLGVKGKMLSPKEKCCGACLWPIPEGTWWSVGWWALQLLEAVKDPVMWWMVALVTPVVVTTTHF